MDSALDRVFLDFSAAKLIQLASRIQDCLGRLSPERIWARSNDNQNAVGNLVLHLCGNVRQWIISGVGGLDAPELSQRLQATVEEAVAVLNSLPRERLAARVRIQA